MHQPMQLCKQPSKLVTCNKTVMMPKFMTRKKPGQAHMLSAAWQFCALAYQVNNA